VKPLFPDPIAESPLSGGEFDSAVRLLLDPSIPDGKKMNFLTSLHSRGETAEELAGFARVLLDSAVQPVIGRDPSAPLLELCGTGGDMAGFLNVSTAAMFVAAGAGARIVKHGNRAVSSRCGSADVLEALGISLHLKPEGVGGVLDRAGCVFLLASDFHPAVAAVAPLRKALAALGQRTIFNLLGPLLNPAFPDVQLTGIYAASKLELYATAMGLLGRRVSWAVHGESPDGGGVDEISITGPSQIFSNQGGRLEQFVLDPVGLGFPSVQSTEILMGGDAAENADRISAILSGGETGAARDMIVLNAAAALHLCGRVEKLDEAVCLASESIDSGRAYRSLELLREASSAAEF